MSMNKYNNFTVEETNLLSIYMTGSKEGLVVAMNAALPFMEGEMRDFAARTLAKVGRMTEAQSRKVNALVRRTCCNYDSGNCILLDDGDECVCPQLISYSLLCKWFRIAVLSADKELYAELYHAEDMRCCSVCGAPFASSSNRAIYCPDCRKHITRRQTAERMRKMRANVTR